MNCLCECCLSEGIYGDMSLPLIIELSLKFYSYSLIILEHCVPCSNGTVNLYHFSLTRTGKFLLKENVNVTKINNFSNDDVQIVIYIRLDCSDKTFTFNYNIIFIETIIYNTIGKIIKYRWLS